jgi:hypothetical protein
MINLLLLSPDRLLASLECFCGGVRGHGGDIRSCRGGLRDVARSVLAICAHPADGIGCRGATRLAGRISPSVI